MIEMKSHVFSFGKVSLSLHSFVLCLAAVSAVEMDMKNHVVSFEEVSRSPRSVVFCPSAAFVVEMEMRSHAVVAEICFVLAVVHVLCLCLFCCAQGFLSVLVISKVGADKEFIRLNRNTVWICRGTLHITSRTSILFGLSSLRPRRLLSGDLPFLFFSDSSARESDLFCGFCFWGD